MPPEQGNATVSGPRDAGEARPRVLVVADNATERLVLARQLDRLGLVATAVGDGTAAVEAVRRERYDAVLMDRHLPAEDGLEATRLIRRAPRGIDLPIIVMSADTRAEHKRECLDAGVNDYLPKPLEMARLRDTLDDEALFGELVSTFLVELPKRWSALADAAAAGDAHRLGEVAHQLGGSAAQLGAVRLAVLCRQLQFATGTGARPVTLVAAIEIECLALPAALERARQMLAVL